LIVVTEKAGNDSEGSCADDVKERSDTGGDNGSENESKRPQETTSFRTVSERLIGEVEGVHFLGPKPISNGRRTPNIKCAMGYKYGSLRQRVGKMEDCKQARSMSRSKCSLEATKIMERTKL
jgi:hypothetical protein